MKNYRYRNKRITGGCCQQPPASALDVLTEKNKQYIINLKNMLVKKIIHI